MTRLTEYIQEKDNLRPLSMWITSAILILVFLFAQVVGYSSPREPEVEKKRMEIRELMKLTFKPEAKKTPKKRNRGPKKKKSNPKARVARKSKPKTRPVVEKPNVTELLKGLNTKKLSKTRSTTRRNTPNTPAQQSKGISTNTKRPTRHSSNVDMNISYNSRPSHRPSGRRAPAGSAAGATIATGSASRGATVANVDGSALAGRTSARTTRVAGSGAGGAKISMPTASGEGEAALDLHALIKWMKEHPGKIPPLVAHEMGHKAGDLSSAVQFTMGGKNYTMYLSCNEVEMLLRVCLIEGNDFILLKDNGIRQESNYLTVGDVMRKGVKIQSLISRREAPRNMATKFYSIFWSWWQNESK